VFRPPTFVNYRIISCNHNYVITNPAIMLPNQINHRSIRNVGSGHLDFGVSKMWLNFCFGWLRCSDRAIYEVTVYLRLFAIIAIRKKFQSILGRGHVAGMLYGNACQCLILFISCVVAPFPPPPKKFAV